MRKSIAVVVCLAFIGCGNKDKERAKAEAEAAKAKEAAVAKAKAEEEAKAKEPPPPPKDSKIVVEGFSTPESVLYDDLADVYLVSNINGTPFDNDDNGFISQVKPDGVVQAKQWIDGAKPDVRLDAPKGMAFLGDTLYVADINTVRMFDRKTGASKGEVVIKPATFLNDVAAGDGVVYVSDSGIGAGFKPNGSDAVFEVKDGKFKAIASQSKKLDLGGPNGLVVADGKVWTVTFRTGELYRIDDKGAKADAVKLPKGGLDGLVITKDGKLLISSWEGQVVFQGPAPAGPFTDKVTGVDSPADLGLDTKRDRVLIPLFQKNSIVIYPLAE